MRGQMAATCVVADYSYKSPEMVKHVFRRFILFSNMFLFFLVLNVLFYFV
jgi:hypothetical protein